MSEVWAHLRTLADQVQLTGERIIVRRRERPLFALVPFEDVWILEQLEDRLDLDAIRAAEGEPTTSWPQVKKALGL